MSLIKQAKAALVLKVGHVSTSPCPHLLTARSVTRPRTTGHVLNVSPVPALERSHILTNIFAPTPTSRVAPHTICSPSKATGTLCVKRPAIATCDPPYLTTKSARAAPAPECKSCARPRALTHTNEHFRPRRRHRASRLTLYVPRLKPPGHCV